MLFDLWYGIVEGKGIVVVKQCGSCVRDMRIGEQRERKAVERTDARFIKLDLESTRRAAAK